MKEGKERKKERKQNGQNAMVYTERRRKCVRRYTSACYHEGNNF